MLSETTKAQNFSIKPLIYFDYCFSNQKKESAT